MMKHSEFVNSLLKDWFFQCQNHGLHCNDDAVGRESCVLNPFLYFLIHAGDSNYLEGSCVQYHVHTLVKNQTPNPHDDDDDDDQSPHDLILSEMIVIKKGHKFYFSRMQR